MVYDGHAWDSTISFDSGASLTAAGTLSLTLDPSVNVSSLIGQSFLRLFDWTGAAHTGAFAVSASGAWDYSNLYTTGIVTLTVLPGDANVDGTTNGTDLNIMLSNYNQTGMDWAQGDFNGDGTVNGSDLNTILSNYNQHVGATAAVPEPGTLGMLALGALGLLAWKGRRKRR